MNLPTIWLTVKHKIISDIIRGGEQKKDLNHFIVIIINILHVIITLWLNAQFIWINFISNRKNIVLKAGQMLFSVSLSCSSCSIGC